MTETPTSAPVADLGRVQSAVLRLVEGVRPDQWPSPTPCADWDVRALVNHLVGGDNMFMLIAAGRVATIEEAREIRAQRGDQLGDDPPAAYRAAALGVRDAFEAPGFLEGSWPGPSGPTPGDTLVRMRVNEHLVHGWDLARATGQPASVLPEDLAEEGLRHWRQALAGRPRDSRVFGPEQAAPHDAPAIDRLAAFLGRSL